MASLLCSAPSPQPASDITATVTITAPVRVVKIVPVWDFVIVLILWGVDGCVDMLCFTAVDSGVASPS